LPGAVTAGKRDDRVAAMAKYQATELIARTL
jgi:hypothetical protein